MRIKNRAAIALIGGAVLLASFVGCAPAADGGSKGGGSGTDKPAASSSQTVEEGCQVFTEEFTAYNAAVKAEYQEIDPAELTPERLVADQKTAIAEMERVAGLITNDEVSTAYGALVQVSKDSLLIMEAIMAAPDGGAEIQDSQEYTDLVAKNTSVSADFEKVCPGAIAASSGVEAETE